MRESPGAVVAWDEGVRVMWEWVAMTALGATVILQAVASAVVWGRVSALRAIRDAQAQAAWREREEGRRARWDDQVRAVYDLFIAAERYLATSGADTRADLLDALARSEYIRTELGPCPSRTPVPFQTWAARDRAV